MAHEGGAPGGGGDLAALRGPEQPGPVDLTPIIEELTNIMLALPEEQAVLISQAIASLEQVAGGPQPLQDIGAVPETGLGGGGQAVPPSAPGGGLAGLL